MYRKTLAFVGLITSSLMAGNTLAIPPRVPTPKGTAFAQLSSALDQLPGSLVKFERKDALQRVSATDDTIVVQQSGTYLIIASPQITALKDGGCMNMWLIINGQAVKNSGVRSCQAKAGNTNVTVSQLTMALQEGDKIQVRTSGVNTKLDAIAPQGEPLIPSIILSVVGLTY